MTYRCTAVDQGNVGAFALLDLSSAFDTVNHQLLLAVLQKRFAVTNSTLTWSQSYSADRTQTVHLHTDVSDTIRVRVLRFLALGGTCNPWLRLFYGIHVTVIVTIACHYVTGARFTVPSGRRGRNSDDQ